MMKARVQLYVETSLYERVRSMSKNYGVSITSVVERAIRRLVDSEDKPDDTCQGYCAHCDTPGCELSQSAGPVLKPGAWRETVPWEQPGERKSK
jgi:hypothetical protein